MKAAAITIPRKMMWATGFFRASGSDRKKMPPVSAIPINVKTE
jgi:hypothetical protein